MKKGKMVRSIFLVIFLVVCLAAFNGSANAQSTDPDNPTSLSGNTIAGSSSGGLSDTKTYYYAFSVNKGTLTGTFDVTPLNKSDGGGLLAWTFLNTKFQSLKYDNLSAQGSPQRKVKDMPVTVKRRLILKIEISGNANYKIKLEGTALGK